MKRAAIALILVGCSGGHITPQDSTVVAAEQAEGVSCVERFKPNAADINTCRAAVKAKYDAYWAEHFDGGAK
jgi:hypothetical protein